MIKRLAFLDVCIIIAVPSVFNRLADLVSSQNSLNSQFDNTIWQYSLKVQLVSSGNAPTSGHHYFDKVNRTAEKIGPVIQGHASR